MRIGDTVVRVKEEHNLRKIGDIAVIDRLKIYNNGVCVHLEGDKPDTWHAESNYRNIEDVDVVYLEAKLAHVAEKIREQMVKRPRLSDEAMVKRKAKRAATMRAKKGLPMVEEFFGEEPEDDEPFDFSEGIFIRGRKEPLL